MNTLKQAAASLDSGKSGPETTGLTVLLNGSVADEAQDVTPRDFATHLAAGLLAREMGMAVEFVLDNPNVFNILTGEGKVTGTEDGLLKVSLKAA